MKLSLRKNSRPGDRLFQLKMTALEFDRLIEWAKSLPRKSAELAFTSGAARDCARVIERVMPEKLLSRISYLEKALKKAKQAIYSYSSANSDPETRCSNTRYEKMVEAIFESFRK